MNKKIGIGIIGTGFARRVQIPGFNACEGVEITSVASGSIENAQVTAKEFGVAHYTADWRETVANADVDLVCITTPPVLHKEMALFAIDAGKHVLCEKPMAMNVDEAAQMTSAAEGKRLLALIDHELRFQPGRQLAYEMLRDGRIGKIRHAKASFQAPHRGDPNLPWNWWSDEASGGGALGAINSHIIDSLNWLLGTTIREVYCKLHTNIKQRRDREGKLRPVTTDDEANMIIAFLDGELTDDATGMVSVSMTEGPKYSNRLEFYGSEGALRIDHRGELFIARSADDDWTEIAVGFGKLVEGVPDTGFARGFMDFAPKIVEALRHGNKTIEHAATFSDGLAVQVVLDAARESDRTGRSVHI